MLDALKNKLQDSLDVTAAQQEMWAAREKELAKIKKLLEHEMAQHKLSTTNLRHKHIGEIVQLNNQLDMVKKSKASASEGNSQLEAELADPTN